VHATGEKEREHGDSEGGRTRSCGGDTVGIENKIRKSTREVRRQEKRVGKRHSRSQWEKNFGPNQSF
jgi:hypothetical protein